jgi:hypothetical protein
MRIGDAFTLSGELDEHSEHTLDRFTSSSGRPHEDGYRACEGRLIPVVKKRAHRRGDVFDAFLTSDYAKELLRIERRIVAEVTAALTPRT